MVAFCSCPCVLRTSHTPTLHKKHRYKNRWILVSFVGVLSFCFSAGVFFPWVCRTVPTGSVCAFPWVCSSLGCVAQYPAGNSHSNARGVFFPWVCVPFCLIPLESILQIYALKNKLVCVKHPAPLGKIPKTKANPPHRVSGGFCSRACILSHAHLQRIAIKIGGGGCLFFLPFLPRSHPHVA